MVEQSEYAKVVESAFVKSRAMIYQNAPTDFACFCRAVVKDEETREHIALAPHQLEWLDHIDRCRAEGKFAGILAPPGSGKSQLFSIAFPLWSAGGDPRLRCAVVGSDAKLVKRRVRPAKEYVQYDPDFRAIFPNALPEKPEKWTEQEFSIQRPRGIKDPSYLGAGITQPPQGSRIDLLVNDDICDYDNTISEPAMRDKVIDLWYNGFDTRLGPRGFVVHIGGVIHARDLNVRLTNDPRFWFIKQSISNDFQSLIHEDMRTGETKTIDLWSRAWTPEFLEQKKRSNPRAYKRAYQHQGYDDSERTFSETSIKASIRKPPSSIPSGVAYFIGVDLAGKNRAGNVIATIAVGDKRTVVDVERGAWSSDETARRIIAAYDRYHPSVIMVENNAYQQALIDWMGIVSDRPLPIEPFTTGKQKADEVLGLPGMSAEFLNGMWEIPFDEDHVVAMGCDCGRCALVSELLDHPFGSSDAVMAVWFARCGAMKYGSRVDPEFIQAKGIGRSVGGGGNRERSRLNAFRKSRRGL